MVRRTHLLTAISTALLLGSSAVHAATPSSVTASSDDGNVPANTLDNDPSFSTRWSAKGDDGSQWIRYDFGSSTSLSGVDIAFFKGNERNSYFQVQSSDDGSNWTTRLGTTTSSGNSLENEAFDFSSDVSARYFRIVGFGNSSNTWNSLTNVEFVDGETDSNNPEQSVSVTASADDGNVPENTLDDDPTFSTRWSANGNDGSQWIRYDFGESTALSGVDIAFFKGDQRNSYFEIQSSNDASSWSSVLGQSTSSGNTLENQSFDFPAGVAARYIRIVGYGNSSNTWNSLTNVEFSYGNGEGTGTDDDTADNGNSDQQCNIDMTIWGYTLGNGVSRNDQSDIQDLVDNVDLGGDELTWDDGCPTFKVGNDASSSSGSSYARSELRELLTRYYDSDPGVKEIENNWVTSNYSDSDLGDAGGVDGTLNATLKVNTVSVDRVSTDSSTKDDQVGRIIVGQIHGVDHEPVKIYYQKHPDHDKGSVYFTVDGSSGSPVDRVYVIGYSDKDYAKHVNGSETLSEPENGIALGDLWSYEIDLTGDQLRVTIWHDDNVYTTADAIAYSKTQSRALLSNSSDTNAITISDYYDDDWMYFKAGLYNQNNSGVQSPNYASVTFYAIDVQH